MEAPQDGASCELLTPDGGKGLEVVHRARNGSAGESQVVVDAWLPTTAQMLDAPTVTRDWLHMAVDLGRELTRLGKHPDARQLLKRVIEIDRDGEWGKAAATQLKDLPD